MSLFSLPATSNTPMTGMSDRALLDIARNGDERAFEELFVRHVAGVRRVTERIVGDPEEAEELTHDVFLKLYDRRLGDSNESNLRAWLYRVATNAAFNAVRSRRRRRGWLKRLAGRAEAGDRDDRDPSVIVAERDEVNQIRLALAELPARQRTTLVLKASGLSYIEIAEVIGVRAASVGTILARAERAFRETYEAKYGEKGGSDA